MSMKIQMCGLVRSQRPSFGLPGRRVLEPKAIRLLIADCGQFVSDKRSISPRIDEERMCKNRSAIFRGIRDVIGRCTARRVQSEKIPDALRNLVVGASGVSTDAQSADDLSILVNRDATSEEDHAACNLLISTA